MTLPKQVRDQLGLKAGDILLYELEGRAVRIEKAGPFDGAWHQALEHTLEEWGSPEDAEAFDGL